MIVDPGKITRVNLPYLNADVDVNYWMSELNPNIYLTEISVPGSKMSVLTEARKAHEVFQKSTIEEQFKAGTRAFILQTHVNRKKIKTDRWERPSYTNELYVCCDGANVVSLKQAIKDISTY